MRLIAMDLSDYIENICALAIIVSAVLALIFP
jgi:hypothetical protein